MDPALQLTLRAAFALLMASAAFHKLRDPARFREVMAAYEILPAALVGPFARAVPAVEALLAAAMASDVAGVPAAAMLSALLLAYAAAILVNVRRGRSGIDCGCAGPASPTPLGAGLVWRNLVLAVAAALLMLPLRARSLGWLDLVAVPAATATLAALWLASGRLLALAPRAASLRSAARRSRT